MNFIITKLNLLIIDEKYKNMKTKFKAQKANSSFEVLKVSCIMNNY